MTCLGDTFSRNKAKLICFPWKEGDFQFTTDDFELQIQRSTSVIKEEEQPDALPKRLQVTKLDFFVDFIGFSSYLFDLASDIWIIYYHFMKANHLAFGLLVGDFILTLLILNLMSFIFWLEDYRSNKKYHHRKYFKLSGLIWRLMTCFIGLGPAVFYLDSFVYAWRFRKEVVNRKSPENDALSHSNSSLPPEAKEMYLRMLEADRDATLLRLFEAFMESAPQALIQGYFFTSYVQNHYLGLGPEPTLEYYIVQSLSLTFSLISMAWSIIAQHRCLRFARQDKENISWAGCFMQMVWRFFTISSRILIIIAFTLAFEHWSPIALTMHFGLSVVFLLICQKMDSGASWYFEVLIIFAVSFVHVIAPFNMTDGKSRVRYAFSYGLEFVELLTFLLLCYFYEPFEFPCKPWLLLAILFSFGLGICAMILYYGLLHPLKGTCIVNNSKRSAQA